jgi:hypothetical protein
MIGRKWQKERQTVEKKKGLRPIKAGKPISPRTAAQRCRLAETRSSIAGLAVPAVSSGRTFRANHQFKPSSLYRIDAAAARVA